MISSNINLHLVLHAYPTISAGNNSRLRCTNGHNCSLKKKSPNVSSPHTAYNVKFFMKGFIVEELTVPGGRMASKRSTPNIPRFDRVKVPTKTNSIAMRKHLKGISESHGITSSDFGVADR